MKEKMWKIPIDYDNHIPIFVHLNCGKEYNMIEFKSGEYQTSLSIKEARALAEALMDLVRYHHGF